MSRMRPPSDADNADYGNDSRRQHDRSAQHKKAKFPADQRRADDGHNAADRSRDAHGGADDGANAAGLDDVAAAAALGAGSTRGAGRLAVHRVMTAVGMRRPPGAAGEKFVPVHQRRGFRPISFVLVLFLVIWLMPIVIGHSPLLNSLLAVGTGDLKGSVTIGSASLGWFSPVTLWNLEVRDTRHEPVLVIPKAVGDRTLISILWDNSRLGRFRVEQPQVSLLFDQQGSNLEDMLAKYLARKQKSNRRYGVTLEVVDGTIFLRDCQRNLGCKLENLQLTLTNPALPQQPFELEAAGSLVEMVADGGAARSGRLNVSLEVGPLPVEGEEPGNSLRMKATGGVSLPKTGRLKLGLESLPLAIWQPLAARFTSITALDGRATGMVQVQWNGPVSDKTRLDANLVADDLVLGARPLGRDQLRLRQLRSTCSIGWPAEEVRVNKLSAECELGTASLTGMFHVGKITAHGVLEALHEQTYEIASDLDLAGLAQMLPNTLRIQRDTQVTGGRLVAACNSRPGTEGGVLQGRFEAAQVRAVKNGRELRWDQPIVLTLAAHQKYPALVIDNLNCQSSFLQMEGSGNSSHLTATAHCDLDQLAAQLGQFVDLGGTKLTGQAWAHVDWQHRDRDGFAADASFQVRKLAFTLPQREPAAEASYDARLSLTGLTDGTSIARVDTAVLNVETLVDKLEAHLTAPVNDMRDGGAWPMAVQLQGKLDAWPHRLRPWIDLNDWYCTGQGQVTGQVVVARSGVAAQALHLMAAPLAISRAGVIVNEPKAELTITGNWDRQTGRVAVEQATLSSNMLSVRLTDFTLATPQGDAPLALTGAVQYQGKLSGLRQWFSASAAQTSLTPLQPAVQSPTAWGAAATAGRRAGYGQPTAPATPGLPLAATAPVSNVKIDGDLVGQGRIAQSDGLLHANLDSTINNFTLSGPAGKPLTQPQMRLLVQATYNPSTQALEFQQLSLASGIIDGNATGRTTGGNDSRIDLSGNFQYDLEKLSDLAQPYFEGKLRLVGRGTTPLTLAGPLDPQTIEGSAALGWTEGYAYGLRLGAGQLKGRMAGGQVQFDPLAMDASEGRLQLSPTLRLAPLELSLASGVVAQQIRVDPATCEALLKYVVPALSELSTAEGKFSIQLDTCRIPLDDPAAGQLSGRLTVHSLQLSPGPLVTELGNLLGHPGPAKLTPESVITFHMRDRKIYHEGLELALGDATVRTSGWVGFDQTLSLAAQMPFPQRLITDNALGASLRNQTITLPITGTLHQLSIDQRALQDATRQFAQNAATGALQNAVGGALQNALGGPGQNGPGAAGLPGGVGNALQNAFGGGQPAAPPANPAVNPTQRQAEQLYNRQR